MQLYELIHSLQRVEQALGGHIPVYIRSSYEGDIELFVVVPEKDDEGDYLLVLE